MTTTVVNLYHDQYDVYIGRAGRGQVGTFGNPIRIGYQCIMCKQTHADAGSTLPCYEQYLWKMVSYGDFKEHLRALKGKRLGCFCKPKPCHGDVLARWIDEYL